MDCTLSVGRYDGRLCFADQSGLSKFFQRMRGINPKRVRMER